jgi:hypothetical protein
LFICLKCSYLFTNLPNASSILPIKLYVLPSYTHNKVNVFDVQGIQWIPIEKVWVALNLRNKIPYSWYSQRRKNSMLHCFVGLNNILFANCVFLSTNLVSKWSIRPRFIQLWSNNKEEELDVVLWDKRTSSFRIVWGL